MRRILRALAPFAMVAAAVTLCEDVTDPEG